MRLSRLLCLAVLCLIVQHATELLSRAEAQACPLGKTCFYLPPIQPAPPVAPDGYTDVAIMSAPTQAATYTLEYSSGSPAASTGSVGVGSAPQVTIYPGNVASGFNIAEQRGVMITADRSDLIVEQRTPALYWQSSSTIRAHTLALGTRFRVAGYNLNNASGDNTGYDFVSLYAPQGATITVAAPASGPSSFWSGFAGQTVIVTLTAGQTYLLRTLTGVDIDATLVTSTVPISVVVGGRGWGCNSAGDEGADQAVPTALFGQDFVVRRYPAPSLQDVRVVADTDNTQVSVNGVVQATINAGGVYLLDGHSGVSLIHASQPVGVYQNAGSTTCENDLAAIPPLSFGNIPNSSLGFRTIGTGYGTVVAPTATISSLRLDNAVVAAAPAAVPGRADVSTVNFTLAAGVHKIDINSDLQFGMVSDTGGTGMFAYYNPWRIAGCGDGMLTGTEACDDGNVVDGDGCSSVCGVAPGFTCSGSIGAQSTCVCAADAVCSGSQYCDAGGVTNACTAKATNGSTLPTQHGTCGGAAGTLGSAATACASGQCNATAGTCAGTNGASCTLSGQCVANHCGSNGSCGGVNGQDTCASASDCQSGNCSAQGGVCIPSPTSCWADADCAANNFCHRDTFTCQTKLAAGVALPSDSLHATCANDQLNSACQSGQCNSSAATCAAANGASCSAAAQCTNNRCGSNGSCGGANGQDGCAVATQTGDCQSGHCSPNAMICIPTASGCWVDTDCASDKFCQRSTYTCQSTLANGTALPQDGLHAGCAGGISAACASGQCNVLTGSCAGPNGTTSCTTASQCASNRCGSNGSCGGVSGTDSCSVDTQATDCQSGHCSANAEICIDGSSGCWVDEDCPSDRYCARSRYTCELKLSHGTDLPEDDLHDDCDTGNVNSACESGRCNPTAGTCAGVNGNTDCTAAAQCITNRCGSNGSCGGTSGVDSCTTGTEASDCQSGQCSPSAGRCIEGSSGCWVDADCASGKFCHRASYTCQDQLVAGAALPDDDLHESCPVGSLNAACASGLCNTAAGSCASANGTSGCTLPAQCLNNYCGSNGRCGGVNGVDTCTIDTAASACQSGHCSANAGMCVDGSSGCWVDADCPGDKFCARDSYSCTTKLAAGTALPQDGLHGACAQGDSNGACASGRCNASTETCALTHGMGCSEDAQCIAGRCGDDDLCGGTAGERCSGPQLCRTNLCGDSGVCLPVDGCDSDAGCWSGNYCDLDTLLCKPALGPGAHIPSDHGVCGITVGDAGNFERACASGVCNATSNTCALAQGAGTCSSASECSSNICASDGKCGNADGTGSCSADNAATACRSGVCSASGVCIPDTVNACWTDSDCGSGLYCDRAALTCREKLAAGEPLPSDGLHASCPETHANAACQLGLCNAATGTCAGPNLTACTTGTECVWDTCDPSDGRCGFARGGECTDETAAQVCRSGSCQPTGVCLSAGPCTSDADCATADHCAVDLTCAVDLPNGQPIPAGHGTCAANPGSLGTAESACTSGQCNPTSNTCAGPHAAACASALECSGASCGSDNACGYLPGQGPCTPATAAILCRSGACSPSGAKCIPSKPNSCWNDDDCAAAEFCLRDTFTCTAKLNAGSALPADGLHDVCSQTTHVSAACASGRCNASTLSCAGDIGTDCSRPEDCIANFCHEDGQCGLPTASGPCSAADAVNVCRTRMCGGNGKCSLSSACAKDGDCAQGRYCDALTLTCIPVRLPGAAIPSDREACAQDGAASDAAHRACLGNLCNPVTNTCAGANDVVACTAASECGSNTCGNDGRCGRPNGGGPCTADNAALVCRSGSCAASSGVCVAAGGCWLDADCEPAQYCDHATQRCESARDSGQTLPPDGMHASCPDNGQSSACRSGLCNAQAQTCSYANSTDCTAAEECSANVCGSNGRCGLAAGEPGCDVVTGVALCQSGACTDAGVCSAELSGVGSCAQDTECGADQYCNAQSQSCVDKLESGQRLPADGSHTRCVAQQSNACESGNCEADRCVSIGLRGGGLCSAGFSGETPADTTWWLITFAALMIAWRVRRRDL